MRSVSRSRQRPPDQAIIRVDAEHYSRVEATNLESPGMGGPGS